MKDPRSEKPALSQQAGPKFPPTGLANEYPVDAWFEHEGETFVRRADGVVCLVLSLPIHEPSSDWSSIEQLALSFDGYEHAGSFEKCAKIGNGMARRFAKNGGLRGDLEELRSALFSSSAASDTWDGPGEEEMPYIRALAAAVRARRSKSRPPR